MVSNHSYLYFFSIHGGSSVRTYLDCHWITTQVLHKHALNVPEDTDLIIGYMFQVRTQNICYELLEVPRKHPWVHIWFEFPVIIAMYLWQFSRKHFLTTNFPCQKMHRKKRLTPFIGQKNGTNSPCFRDAWSYWAETVTNPS